MRHRRAPGPILGLVSRCLRALAISLSFSISAFALDCEIEPVESLYERSSDVFLGQIIATELIGREKQKDDINVSQVRHRFKVLETFKGTVDYDSFKTGFLWNQKVPHFEVGDVNLFFMGEQPGFNSCSPRYLMGQKDTDAVLARIRSLKAGVVKRMTGIWTARSEQGYCSVYTTYVVPKTSASLSLSVQYTAAERGRPAYSSLWVYSHAKNTGEVAGDSGLVLSLSDQKISVPYSNSQTENDANFYTRFDHRSQLLAEILAENDVILSGVTRGDEPVYIPVLLNGGSAAIEEFAMCSDRKSLLK